MKSYIMIMKGNGWRSMGYFYPLLQSRDSVLMMWQLVHIILNNHRQRFLSDI
jgi:hypothetical protein